MPITILELAERRGVKHDSDGSVCGDAMASVGLAIIGGCAGCGATIAAYNAYPTKMGCWACEDCVGEWGWDDVSQANKDIFGDDDEGEKEDEHDE